LSRACLLTFALIFPGLSGCGGTATVSGQVTVDGEPLKNGVISYVPADDSGAPATTAIQDGKYELQMVPGKKFVQISAPGAVRKVREYNAPDAPEIVITDERLPARYNSATDLVLEVKAGINTKDWDLDTKKAP
jgi:hypothetical protein